MAKWKVVGIDFSHMHMGDNLRMAHGHPDAEIVGICDERPGLMRDAIRNFAIPEDRVFTDWEKCLDICRPDLVILCPATSEHGLWTRRIAEWNVNILMEKPFADSLAEADSMIAAMKNTGKLLAINWPLAWYPPHVTTKRMIDRGLIGEVRSVSFYDGNRGPLWHLADKVETDQATVDKGKSSSWFYKKAAGGGSLLDYLGYGTTLGSWFLGDQSPREVISVVDEQSGMEVDEQSITIVRFDGGLSKFETRWGTFTDPWTHQPQPKCGFVVVGTEGTISSYDFENSIRIQTRERPEGYEMAVDALGFPRSNPVEYVLHCMDTGRPLEGPLSPEISRKGQVLVDCAFRSAYEKRRVSIGE
jgi:glucose-fructose oxidoreductase